LDLRGKRYDMAMHELEKYLDRAFRSGRAEVTIVHGLGTGTIRQGTLELLKSLPYIKSYYDGGTGRGGDGATVVEFARN
ncbi:MAG: Smr/MutS family protein, partial [Xanthomonadaceae bacterium]|nr:Smr/MutS family protein [Xanthomonadaceae bacterium]